MAATADPRLACFVALHVSNAKDLAYARFMLDSWGTQTAQIRMIIGASAATPDLHQLLEREVATTYAARRPHLEVVTAPAPRSQFQHYRTCLERCKEMPDNSFVMFSDANEIWAPRRVNTFLSNLEKLRKREKRESSLFVRMTISGLVLSRHGSGRNTYEVRTANDVDKLMADGRASAISLDATETAASLEKLASAVRLSAFREFMAAAPECVLAHYLAEEYFSTFFDLYGEAANACVGERMGTLVSDPREWMFFCRPAKESMRMPPDLSVQFTHEVLPLENYIRVSRLECEKSNPSAKDTHMSLMMAFTLGSALHDGMVFTCARGGSAKTLSSKWFKNNHQVMGRLVRNASSVSINIIMEALSQMPQFGPRGYGWPMDEARYKTYFPHPELVD